MSETYLITAKTVEEAVSIANREYADSEHEVSYDIIEMPKKGFLGIGARDAKIKVTVTKTQAVELGSLVADMKSMKRITDRGGEEEKPKPRQNQPKNEGKKPEAQANTNAPKENRENAKSAKPKNPQNQQGAKKPAEKAESKPDGKPKEEKKPAAKQEVKQDAKSESKQDVKSEIKKEAKPEVSAEAKSEEVEKKSNGSALGNQVKQKNRRGEQVKKTPAQNDIPSSGVTVSAPVGLSDFVSGSDSTAFGSSGYESGKMSNDIKKKPKITDPAKANMDALKALTAPPPDAKPEAKNEKSEKPDNRRSKDQKKNLPKPEVKSEPKEAKEPKAPEAASEAQEAAEVEAKPEEKKVREAVTQAEMDYALEFANTLLENMKLDARAVPATPEEGEEFIVKGDQVVYPKINIIGEDTGILIGHHGETLDSIQYLVNLSALRRSKQKDGDYVKIVVDIEGYREKREETLRVLARRMAARAVKYKRNVFLEPMNAYERRIIHSELQSYENVSTHSVGTDRDRKIIITYEGPDKREKEKREDKESKPREVEVRQKSRKPKKLPIEKLPDLLEAREDASAESESAEGANE